MRIIYKKIYDIFAKHLPKSNSKYNFGQKTIRYKLAKKFITYMGKDVNIEKKATFPYSLSIGDRSGVGVRCEINGKVTIGKDVLMGPDVIMYTRNHNFSDLNIPIGKQGYDEEKPIVIGDDVWIGRRVIILAGVHIGNGAVIGAGAVVAKNIPPFAIAVGNPVQILKYRNM